MISTYRRDTLALLVIVFVVLTAACTSAPRTQLAEPAVTAPAPQVPASAEQAGAGDALPVIVRQPSELTPRLCEAVAEWADVAPTLTDQILENMRPGIETTDLQAAARVIEELDPSGDVGAFIAAWTIVMRDRQGYITAVGGPADLFETDIALYEVSLLEPVEGIDTASIAQRIEAGCDVVVPVEAP